jgi:Domain of unknown function (DUF4221)
MKEHKFLTIKSLIIYRFIIVGTFFSSCNSDAFENFSYKEIPTNYDSKKIKLKKQEIYINLPKKYLPSYNIISTSFKIYMDSTIMGIYNENNKSIDLFNIDSKKLVHQVILPKTLLNGYGTASKRPISINSIYIQSLDSIFFLTEKGLYIVNSNGNIIYSKINLNFSNGVSSNEVVYRNSGNFPIYFDSNSNNVYMYGFCNKYSTYSNKFYNEPIENSYNLNGNVFNQLPMKFSELFKTGYFSVSIYPQRLIIDNYHIYTFQQDPNIYIYDKLKKEITVKGGKSKFQKEMIHYFSKTVSFSKDKEIAYLKTVPSYGKLLYDPYRNLFYRFFQQGQSIKNTEGLYNTEFDKYEILIIFDKDFNVLNEINLERYKYFSTFSFVTKDGLFISDKNIYDLSIISDSLKFHLFTIHAK